MPRERRAATQERAQEIYRRLTERYPDAHCALNHRNAFELTVATILSAQCTDARVNQVTPELFRAYPDPPSLAAAPLSSVEGLIHSTGFFRSKARNLVGMAQAVEERHGGEIPRTLEELVALPGVGRKTANVILGNAFGLDEGVVVDTHVKRIAKRLGWTRRVDPVRVEQDLVRLFPQTQWTMLSHLLIFLGRDLCPARKPRCAQCPLVDLCPAAPADLRVLPPSP